MANLLGKPVMCRLPLCQGVWTVVADDGGVLVEIERHEDCVHKYCDRQLLVEVGKPMDVVKYCGLDDQMVGHYECPACQRRSVQREYNFCPICGVGLKFSA